MKLKKEELKLVLKPVIEECVREMIAEKGFLSSIINEVYVAAGNRTIVKEQQQSSYEQKESEFIRQKAQKSNQAIIEHKKKLMDIVEKNSRGSINGVNVFEGVEPLKESAPALAARHSEQAPSAIEVLDPTNSGGVNLNNIPGMNRWSSVLKGVEKLKD